MLSLAAGSSCNSFGLTGMSLLFLFLPPCSVMKSNLRSVLKVASRLGGVDFASNNFGNGNDAFEGFDFNCWTGGAAGMAVTHVLSLTGCE